VTSLASNFHQLNSGSNATLYRHEPPVQRLPEVKVRGHLLPLIRYRERARIIHARFTLCDACKTHMLNSQQGHCRPAGYCCCVQARQHAGSSCRQARCNRLKNSARAHTHATTTTAMSFNCLTQIPPQFISRRACQGARFERPLRHSQAR
jgi:hypothetical protein